VPCSKVWCFSNPYKCHPIKQSLEAFKGCGVTVLVYSLAVLFIVAWLTVLAKGLMDAIRIARRKNR